MLHQSALHIQNHNTRSRPSQVEIDDITNYGFIFYFHYSTFERGISALDFATKKKGSRAGAVKRGISNVYTIITVFIELLRIGRRMCYIGVHIRGAS